MEFIKDIYFNTDKLVENTKVKVSYTGKFYQGNNEKVFLHYGYDKDWNNITDLEMKKTDLGYQAELNLLTGDTLNFCFKNQDNEWDNNFGQNYIFELSTPTDIVNSSNTVTETAISVVPTGFNYWTKRIKETVWKFFTYVPKLISGNYKRNISDENK